MRTLALLSIAAATAALALPSAAAAQPRAGHSWGEPGQRVVVRRGPGPIAQQPGARQFRQFRRIDRGGFLPPMWSGPQFQVQHWQLYGFPQPMPGYRWVRYYDDALLVDGRGRVHDGRYGFDWDRYGDHWSEGDDGVPVYVGNGDFHPRSGERAWAERENEDWDYSEYGYEEGYAARGGDCRETRRGPCGGRGSGYGRGGYGRGGYGRGSYGRGGYGQGSYGYGGATETVTETIVESGGASYTEEVIEEEVVETRARARRQHRRPAPAPRRPIRGERG